MFTLVQYMARMLRTLTLVKERTHLWRTVSAKTNDFYVKHIHPSTDIDTKLFIFSAIADFRE